MHTLILPHAVSKATDTSYRHRTQPVYGIEGDGPALLAETNRPKRVDINMMTLDPGEGNAVWS
ncbi:hypothetical protein, partial [Frankia sp. CiP3]|uniref:hypothetical protein n=1 Tax=Frankia sp. CiP3 TaxID=2880971 RepID=UPI001EF5B802